MMATITVSTHPAMTVDESDSSILAMNFPQSLLGSDTVWRSTVKGRPVA